MINAKMKSLFFDRAAVKDLLDKKTRKALSRAGAFVRTRARSSIRKRKSISAPGSPPSSHAGHLKRLIWFAYDPHARAVVIGPVRFKEGKAPRLLEFGGKGTVKRKSGKIVSANYRSRPFMGPAMEKELPQLPSQWATSVKGG